MIGIIQDMEMRDALVEWVKKYHGIDIAPMELKPRMEADNDWEDKKLVGFEFPFPEIQTPA